MKSIARALLRTRFFALGMLVGYTSMASAANLNLATAPLFAATVQSPLVMLVMGRDHKLFYEAYNDASDLDDDGKLDIRYQPDRIDYFGYFDSHKCYTYNSTATLPRFEPASDTTTKKCGGSTEWSGDFLNYVTTSRMDALRKVLYGGYRVVDSTTETVLERAYIPQDAHSWAKAYDPAYDDYNISDYTPYTSPNSGGRHLFASVTLAGSSDSASAANPPLLRVLTNTTFQAKDWVSKQAPVSGSTCGSASTTCTNSAASAASFALAEAARFSDLSQTTYALSTTQAYATSGAELNNILNAAVSASPSKLCGTTHPTQINGTGNPSSGSGACTGTSYVSNKNYITVFRGKFTVPTSGNYQFGINGDSSIGFVIADDEVGTNSASIYWTGNHRASTVDTSNLTSHSVSKELIAGESYYITFIQQERADNAGSYYLYYRSGSASGSTLEDKHVRVKVCSSATNKESNCTAYGTSTVVYKPTGLLHDYGANDTMKFGLMTGSYTNNTQGGVIRKLISSFTDEYNANTGVFNSSTNGIVKTINKIRIVGWTTGWAYNTNCGWIVDRSMNNGECRNWGNPIGEMMYETLRYFAGFTSPTSTFTYSASTSTLDDNTLGLPPPVTWTNPYATNPRCCKPFELVISDINPSFDTDQIPGTPWASSTLTNPLTDATTSEAANFATLADTIWSNEDGGGSKNVFIGQVGTGSASNGPNPKTATSFRDIRGLAPEEPTKQGGYYSSAAAYWGRIHDINSATGTQNLDTFVVALASPLPRIQIEVDSTTHKKITLVPFAKSVGNYGIPSGDGPTIFKPTNQIVDFYVDRIVNMDGYETDSTVNGGRPWGSFQINYEDVEQGADHDMDAIAQYTFAVNADKTVTITVNSGAASGSIVQHLGYVINGSTADGVYLEVRDSDTGSTSDFDYYLDTPPSKAPYSSTNTTAYKHQPTALPLTATRTFTAGTTTEAKFLNDPLWYAAKWGGFSKPATASEHETIPVDSQWNKYAKFNASLDAKAKKLTEEAARLTAEGKTAEATQATADAAAALAQKKTTPEPANYFLVTNALYLKDQLSSAFNEIIARSGSSSTVAVNSGSLSTDTLLFQAQFNSDSWYGDLIAYPIDENNHGGTINASPAWHAKDELKEQAAGDGWDTDRVLITHNGTQGVPFRWPSNISSLSTTNISATQVNLLLASSGKTTTADRQAYGQDLLDWLRGDNSNTTDFRNRKGWVLGDIVSSDPIYIGPPRRGYADNWGTGAAENSSPYSTFVTNNASRTPVVYVGANDGILHGFRASGTAAGEELIGYVPSTTFKKAPALANSTFNGAHQYLLNGSAAVEDVYMNSQWRTVLLGQTGEGGQAAFLLDVTTPSITNFSEANAANIVKWEFTDADDSDLGYTVGRASIGRMHNGKWMAIISNGYNNTVSDDHVSSTGNAVLYIVDLENKSTRVKLDTGVGINQDPLYPAAADAANRRPNGLASPTMVDIDGDNIIDYIYAGDLFGNMWKFDVTSSSSSSWGSAIKSGSQPAPLYRARASDGSVQPITARPEVGAHPQRHDCTPGESSRDCSVILYFGTGKYLEVGDNSNTGQVTQTFYALADRHGSTTISAAQGSTGMVAQTITNEVALNSNGNSYYLRTTSSNSVDWTASSTKGWYMNLYYNSSNRGERQVTNPLLRNKRIIFTTLIPSTDPCEYGGSGWLMELDALSGKPLTEAPFDLNNDGSYDEKDTSNGTSAGSIPAGVRTADGGIPSAPAVLVRTGENLNDELKATSMSTGEVRTTGENSGRLNRGRQTWRIIQ